MSMMIRRYYRRCLCMWLLVAMVIFDLLTEGMYGLQLHLLKQNLAAPWEINNLHRRKQRRISASQ